MEHSIDVVLTAHDLNAYGSPLGYLFSMLTWSNEPFWCGSYGCDAFGWREGENPFKGFEASEDFNWDITYLKSLDPKGETKGYSEPQGKRAYFVVSDMQKALDALTGIAASFSVGYEDGVVKLYAWNKEKPDFKACLMAKYDWEDWCSLYYERYTDSGWKLLEYTYDIDTPNPVFKDGKLVFGDEFSKTPEEFVEDIVKATQGEGNYSHYLLFERD